MTLGLREDPHSRVIPGPLVSCARATALALALRLVADSVTEVVPDGCGHHSAEEQPARLNETLRLP